MARALRGKQAPQRVLDLGAGDGSFALRVATILGWREMELVLLDSNSSLSPEIRDALGAMNCQTRFVVRDAFSGLSDLGEFDVVFTNLFLHHFAVEQLRSLFATVAGQANAFVACEPRRSLLSLVASRGVFLLGCNDVTSHDAVASVRAGFRGSELCALWPKGDSWQLTERRAGLFSHLFFAERKS
jgi:SAM-dependent methyltransferase